MKNVTRMIDEIHRILKPGSRFITFSLHPPEEVVCKYDSKKYNWKVSSYHVKSNRWNSQSHRKRSVAHTMIVCDKPLSNGFYYIIIIIIIYIILFLLRFFYERL